MPLSWNEIRSRAAAFVNEWKDAANERAEAQTFWNDFFRIFDVSRRRIASFEAAVKKSSGGQGFIDLFWPGVLIAEHKSRGKDLGSAYTQALDYFPGLSDRELPRYVVVSDFARFRLHDLEEDTHAEFPLTDLLGHIERFGFIAGYEKRTYDEQDPVNVEAAAKMGALHDRLREAGYAGHDLEVFLVRLLFCLFADDTGIFSPRGSFQDFLDTRTREDGADLGPQLAALFEVLNTPLEARQRTLASEFAAFPYVNGALFAERLRMAHFDAAMRAHLLDACTLDWGAISPAIFGAMFQGALDARERRHLGAHYTSEQNILKLIGPLFMDDLRAEFERAKTSRPKLKAFHDKLAALRLLDPACGCGNFLVVAYRELRLLEIEVIRELSRDALRQGQRVLGIDALVRVNVDQCFGIEIEEFPAQIAQVALWLMDHQMNLKVAEAFGEYFTRLSLRHAAHIRHGNALTLDWNTAFGEAQPEAFDFILGNPPYRGKQLQSDAQKKDLRLALDNVDSAGELDLVAGWFVKAARYMEQHPMTVAAFVSTSSISQGEQVGILWSELFAKHRAKIHFAHRPFRWGNEARGVAVVDVVIIGFALFDLRSKRLFEYESVHGEPHERIVSNINPYLVEGGDVIVVKRSAPLCKVPRMQKGSQPTDGGYLLLSDDEKKELLSKESEAAPYIRPFVGSKEFLNGIPRWCLWLKDAAPQDIRRLPLVINRIENVRRVRLESTKETTRNWASMPMVFTEDRQPTTDYLLVPSVSSVNRHYHPIGYLSEEVIVSNLAFSLPDATLYHFGVLSSRMHTVWMLYTAGRVKNDPRYSNTIVYNNFPWPEAPTEAQRSAVANAAEAVLAARQPHLDAGATLADLYDPLSMPPALARAHATLDRAVDRAYRPQPFPTETHRVAFLFERYEALTNALFAPTGKRRKQNA